MATEDLYSPEEKFDVMESGLLLTKHYLVGTELCEGVDLEAFLDEILIIIDL